MNECKTPSEITSWLLEDIHTGTDWQGKRSKYVHFCSRAIQAAFELGQQSRSLPVFVSVPDMPRVTDDGVLLEQKKYEGPERRKDVVDYTNGANHIAVVNNWTSETIYQGEDRRKNPRGDVARLVLENEKLKDACHWVLFREECFDSVDGVGDKWDGVFKMCDDEPTYEIEKNAASVFLIRCAELYPDKRGDVTRGLVDTALAGGDVQEID